MVVASTKLRNLTVTLLIDILVTIAEYRDRNNYIPQYYQGPDSRRQQIEYCVKHPIKHDPSGIIVIRQK
jgi:hypothetical protein